jgi:cell division septum initiation protein DivIVA
MGALEARVQQVLTRPEPEGRAPDQPGDDEAGAMLSRELERFQRQLQAKVDEAGRRLAGFESQAQGVGDLLMQAQTAREILEPLLEQARDILARARDALRVTEEREARVAELSPMVTSVAEEARCVQDGIERATVKAVRAEQSASAVLDRLIAQTERAQQLADDATSILDRMMTGNVVRATSSGVTKEATASVTDVVGSDPADPSECGGLRGMLTSTRSSLSDLRRLVRQPAGEPASKID